MSDQDINEIIMPPLYQRVFFGESTPQEGMLVFLDLMNFCEIERDYLEQNAGVYRHMGKRSVGVRIKQFTQFYEDDGNLGFKGLIKLHESIDSAAKLKTALIHAHEEKLKYLTKENQDE